jgi:hypothetical protein
MYLHAKKYVGGWSHMKDTSEYETLRRLYPTVPECEDSPSAEVQFNVGYWRKANAIHNWFVQNVQNGEDECRPHYVPREKLVQLRDDCKLEMLVKTMALADHAGVVEPTSGFFFGSDERDEWYYRSLEHTIKVVNDCLAMDDDWSFEYQSSW